MFSPVHPGGVCLQKLKSVTTAQSPTIVPEPRGLLLFQVVRGGIELTLVKFSFLGSNSTPFFQTINAAAAILRANVSRAISARMLFCFNFSTNGANGWRRLPLVDAPTTPETLLPMILCYIAILLRREGNL